MKLRNIQNNVLRRSLLVVYVITLYVPEFVAFWVYITIKNKTWNVLDQFMIAYNYANNYVNPCIRMIWQQPFSDQ